MKLVKLGGSVITYKGRRPRYRGKVVEALAAELAPFRDGLSIVHGGGSFGHPLAQRYGLHQGAKGVDQMMGFAEVHASMRDLNGRVLEALRSAGIPSVSVPPPSLLKMEGGKITSFHGQTFLDHLQSGLVPVTFGDVVLDGSQGSAIVSGDDLMFHLSRLIDPDIVVFVADVEGIRGVDGSILPVVGPPLPDLGGPEGIDVTGGLNRKLEAMVQIARLGIRVLLLGGLVPGRLRRALEGREVPGTVVRA